MLTTLLKGFAMGVAEIIPGVSGSTIAIILKIYEKFIDLLYRFSELARVIIQWLLRRAKRTTVVEKWREIPWGFGLPLLAGMALAIASLSTLIAWVLENYPVYLYAVLFGLLLPTWLIPWQQMKRISWREGLVMVVTFLAFAVILNRSPVTGVNDPSLLLVFVGGFLAISAMVLPGISGSFVLLLLGLYYYIVGLVSNLVHADTTLDDLLTLAVFGTGVVSGFVVLAQILKKALHTLKDVLMAFLIGLILASLQLMWPYLNNVEGKWVRVWPQEMPLSEVLAVSVITMVVAAVMLYLNWRKPKENAVSA